VAFARFQEYGLLCAEHVRATVEEVRHKPFLQREHLQAQLSVVLVQPGGGDEGGPRLTISRAGKRWFAG
jgi:hypothetical protein